MGSRFRNPSDSEISTRKLRNEATPASAESPAYSAIDSGPFRFFIENWPNTIRQNNFPCMAVMFQASAEARLSAAAGESWICKPAPGHTVAWAAVSTGRLLVPQAIEAGDMVTFEEGAKPIHFVADEDTDFVFGSAAKHPHDLRLGYYSVHTTDKALEQGEARIRELGLALRAEGRL